MAKTLDREANEILDEIRSILALSETELADLFGVRRPSLTGWREEGIPATRLATAEQLLDLARVLARELMPTRIAQIVRTPDDWLGGRTILQTVQRDGTAPVYGYLRRLFAYAEAG
jgi:hypothetical protein